MRISKPSLELALKRVRADEIDRVFVRHPYERALIDVDSEAWLDNLGTALEQSKYQPEPMDICDAPKSPMMVRPGGLLNFADRVVFSACVDLCLPSVRRSFLQLPETYDLSNQLSDDSLKTAWLKSRFECWKSFRDESLKALSADVTCVVVADISGFYENIDIPILISDLRAAGAPSETVTQLNACLRKWSQVSGRSVPQGHSAGDILAKFYLNPVDASLGLDYRHLRFVDDFRIFCRTRAEAIKALTELTKLLRGRGLVLNSSKSRIYLADEARQMIEGAIPIIERVREAVVTRITDLMGSHYVSAAESASVLETPEDEIPLELIERTFQAYFIETPLAPFQRTLFHFLLNRLASRNSKFALRYCFEILSQHPRRLRLYSSICAL